MSISRLLKTIFLIEFIQGLIMAIKELFKNLKQLIILLKKVQLAQG